jgi:hypothetical protein
LFFGWRRQLVRLNTAYEVTHGRLFRPEKQSSSLKRLNFARAARRIGPMRMLSRQIVTLLAISAWFAISNHCALATLIKAQPESAGCPMHSAPAKKKSDSAPCCKLLRATSCLTTIKATAATVRLLSPESQPFALALICPRDLQLSPVELDTGPPAGWSFAELILQRRVFAHAPPSQA